jgi:hypothetical protein
MPAQDPQIGLGFNVFGAVVVVEEAGLGIGFMSPPESLLDPGDAGESDPELVVPDGAAQGGAYPAAASWTTSRE